MEQNFPRPIVCVRGSAQMEVPPDYAMIFLRATGFSPESRVDAAREASRTHAQFVESLGEIDGVLEVTFSRMSASQRRVYDNETKEYVYLGWDAVLAGGVKLDLAAVSAVVASAVNQGVEVGFISWELEDDNPAYRQVRKLAVAQAKAAAEDFAQATGMSLGQLRVLADPGLLNAGNSSRSGAFGAPGAVAMSAGSGSTLDEEELDLDPEPQEVHASVEATYELVP